MPMPEAPFPFSDLAPTRRELDFLHDSVIKECSADTGKRGVLEFGAGVTTWAIYTALYDCYYQAVETYTPIIENILLHLPEVHLISSWNMIQKMPDRMFWDVVFVDSSAGYPGNGLHREKAIMHIDGDIGPETLVIIHDWCGKSGKKPRAYLESNGFNLIDAFMGRTGLGIYRRV